MTAPGRHVGPQGGPSARFLARVCLVGLLLLPLSCTDMYDQPSFKAQEAPRVLPPEGAVPVAGKDVIDWGTVISNPVAATRSSISRGKELFAINCAMCHGSEGRGDGLVGKKFNPPPPILVEDRVQQLADEDIYKRIALGFGRMPAFRKRLVPEERWDVVNFVRELRHIPGDNP